MVSKSFLFISILLSLFVFAQCDTIWTQDFNLGNFDEASPLQSIKTDPITIHQSGEATINLSGDIPANSTFEKFVVCISYGVRPSNDATTWAKDGCEGLDTNNRYFELENGQDQDFALRENTLRDIFVTVSVLNITSESNIDNVQLKLTGLNCAVQEVNVGGSCVQYQTLSYGNLYTLTVKAGSWEYFLINVPQNANISTVVFKNYVNAQYFKSNPQQSYMRYGAAPTDEIFDYKGVPSRADSLDIEIVANVAAGGNYIIGVYNNNDTDVNSFYTWDYSTCKPGTFGENCNDQVITVNQQSYLGDQVIAPGEWKYYIVEANDTMLFYVRGNGDSDAPSAYGRLVGFPTSTQYDILSVGSKINILDSDEIPTLNSLRDSIIFNTVAKSTFKATRVWYVGVTNPTASNITFGTWVQTDCPNNCEGRGTCEDHVCKCESDDSDPVTCAANKKKGLKVEYIILIVVACCIIVTAAVGTIVYFYRKKTRHTYESF